MQLKFLSEMLDLLGEDLTRTQVTDRNYGGVMKFDRNALKKRALASGIFSTVMADEEDPHMVKKVSSQPMGPDHHVKADGFNQYVRMLAQDDLMDNIHFPKVYKANTTTDKTGTHRNSFTIERLVDLQNISPEEFEGLAERCFLRPVVDAAAMADRISASCESAYERKMYIRMDSLIEACEIMQRLDQASDFRLDLHEGNLMVRRTPHGLQLVISDPFGMVKRDSMHKYSSKPTH